MTLTLVAALAEAVGLALFSVLATLLFNGSAPSSAHGVLNGLREQIQNRPATFFVILGLTYVAKGLISMVATYASIATALKIADEWRLRLISAILHLSSRSIPPAQGALIQLVIDEPAVAGAGLSALGILVQNLASAATIYLTLFWISPRITLGLTIVGGFAGLLLVALTRYSKKIAVARSRVYEQGYTYISEMVGALKQIKVFGLEQQVVDRAAVHIDEMRSVNRVSNVIASSPRLIIEVVFFGAAMLVLALVGSHVGQAEMLAGAAVCAAAAMRLLPSFSAAAGTWVQIHQSLPALNRIQRELARLEAQTLTAVDGPGQTASFEHQIVCRDLEFSYPNRPPVLRGLNLTINAGEFTAIVGPSGSGKSTLVDLLCGLYDPDGGSISVDGTDLRSISRREWRGLLGVVPQDGFLLSGSVRDNVCLLRPDCPRDDLDRAMEDAGARALIEALPDGYETRLGERGVSLSGGQRQRLALARVLVRHPRILILDEATSALDPTSDASVFRAIGRSRGKMTIVAIAHRLASVRSADKIVVVDQGVVVEEGTHDALLRRGGTYAAMWRAAERHAEPDLPGIAAFG